MRKALSREAAFRVYPSRLCDARARKQAADGKTGTKRTLNPEEEAKKKKRMERFGIVDEKAEAAKRAEAEVRVYAFLSWRSLSTVLARWSWCCFGWRGNLV